MNPSPPRPTPARSSRTVPLPPALELVTAAAELNHQAEHALVWSAGHREAMRRTADTLAHLATLAHPTLCLNVEVQSHGH